MTDQAPTQQPVLEQADPVKAQYVINITPEQYASYLKQAAAKDPNAPPRLQIEMGGSATAKVHFHDASGGTVEITSAEWSSTGPIVVTADEADLMSAQIIPSGLGPATVTATANGAQAHAEVMVIEKIGAPVDGEIEITANAPEPPTGEGGVLVRSSVQGSQIMPVPSSAPPKPGTSTVPPAQVMSQPSPQPQPQPRSESQSQSQPESQPPA